MLRCLSNCIQLCIVTFQRKKANRNAPHPLTKLVISSNITQFVFSFPRLGTHFHNLISFQIGKTKTSLEEEANDIRRHRHMKYSFIRCQSKRHFHY